MVENKTDSLGPDGKLSEKDLAKINYIFASEDKYHDWYIKNKPLYEKKIKVYEEVLGITNEQDSLKAIKAITHQYIYKSTIEQNARLYTKIDEQNKTILTQSIKIKNKNKVIVICVGIGVAEIFGSYIYNVYIKP